MAEEKHLCHAHNCKRVVAPKFLMCPKHWAMCGPKIQALIWQTYRRGQEITKDPSPAYMMAQRSAVWAVFVEEGGCTWPEVPEVGSQGFMIGPACLKQSQGEMFS